MKIVALSCTQKRLPSLTDALLEAAITGVVREVSDAEIQRIRLIDHRIAMCEGEDTCLDPEVARCTLDDDFEHVVDLAEGAQAMLLGAQAGGLATIGNTFWRESDKTDYNNRPGVGVGRKIGMLKPQFKSLTDNLTRQDFGTIALKTAAAA